MAAALLRIPLAHSKPASPLQAMRIGPPRKNPLYPQARRSEPVRLQQIGNLNAILDGGRRQARYFFSALQCLEDRRFGARSGRCTPHSAAPDGPRRAWFPGRRTEAD